MSMEQSGSAADVQTPSVRDTSSVGPETTIRIKDLRIDISTERVHIGDELVPLTATEFRVFRALVMQPTAVIRRSALLLATAKGSQRITSRSLDGHISRLRTKLRAYGVWIRTFKGIGYRFLPTIPIDQSHCLSPKDEDHS
jgi:DNA-binding response OmpR family regulator